MKTLKKVAILTFIIMFASVAFVSNTKAVVADWQDKVWVIGTSGKKGNEVTINITANSDISLDNDSLLLEFDKSKLQYISSTMAVVPNAMIMGGNRENHPAGPDGFAIAMSSTVADRVTIPPRTEIAQVTFKILEGTTENQLLNLVHYANNTRTVLSSGQIAITDDSDNRPAEREKVLSIVPKTITVNLKESEYQKAPEEVRKQITALLEANGFDFSDKEENGMTTKTRVITEIDNDEYSQGYGLNIYKCFYNIQYQYSDNGGASVNTLFYLGNEPFVEVKYAKESGSSSSGGGSSSGGSSKPTPTPTSTQAPDNDKKDNNTNKVNYKMIVGNNNTWSYGKSKNLVFCSNADFSEFVSVSVDGEVIAKENYIAKSGSTIIELKESYLKTLKEGTHKISINSKTGSAEASFKIEKTSETKLTKLPKTGNAMSPVIIVLSVLLVVNIVLTGVMYYKVKRS